LRESGTDKLEGRRRGGLGGERGKREGNQKRQKERATWKRDPKKKWFTEK